ncbi:MAG: tRNA (adenosine(37)-N6)-dimethylallyltransferase MiaA [SAR202 cluster bacterium]|nr:tRNA (adenosine(37)-N6)-dimethylallyltransferase MiaA [SAR202 cluster bacterium]
MSTTPNDHPQRAERRIVAIVGPTGVGKSDLAIKMAKHLGGEVVNADSRQVYRHMDIGTAKPTPQQRAEVPHHLVDILNPDEEYSLAVFQKLAAKAIADIHGRSRKPILVGGTGQYVWGLLEGWQAPEVRPDAALRERLNARLATEGVGALHAELARLDPEAAARVDRLNPRRVIRAIEVAYDSTAASDKPRKVPPHYHATVIGLTLDRALLDARLDARVEAMVAAGWPDEVRRLLAMGYGQGLPSMSSMGYQELARCVAGEVTLEQAVEETKRRTRRFARKQNAWFRPGDPRIAWFQGTEEGHKAALEFIRNAHSGIKSL